MFVHVRGQPFASFRSLLIATTMVVQGLGKRHCSLHGGVSAALRAAPPPLPQTLQQARRHGRVGPGTSSRAPLPHQPLTREKDRPCGDVCLPFFHRHLPALSCARSLLSLATSLNFGYESSLCIIFWYTKIFSSIIILYCTTQPHGGHLFRSPRWTCCVDTRGRSSLRRPSEMLPLVWTEGYAVYSRLCEYVLTVDFVWLKRICALFYWVILPFHNIMSLL